MTPGTEPALTPDEWLGGVNRGTSAGRSHRRAQGAAGFASFLCTIPVQMCPPSPPLPHSWQAQYSDTSLSSPACWMTLSSLPSQIPC